MTKEVLKVWTKMKVSFNDSIHDSWIGLSNIVISLTTAASSYFYNQIEQVASMSVCPRLIGYSV